MEIWVNYVPPVLSFLGVLLTLVVNWNLSLIKQKAEERNEDNKAEITLREGLLDQIEAASEREELLLKRIADRDETIDKLRNEKVGLSKRLNELEIDYLRVVSRLNDLLAYVEQINKDK